MDPNAREITAGRLVAKRKTGHPFNYWSVTIPDRRHHHIGYIMRTVRGSIDVHTAVIRWPGQKGPPNLYEAADPQAALDLVAKHQGVPD